MEEKARTARFSTEQMGNVVNHQACKTRVRGPQLSIHAMTLTHSPGGNMPRWAYLAWQAIYNMVSIHIQVVVSTSRVRAPGT